MITPNFIFCLGGCLRFESNMKRKTDCPVRWGFTVERISGLKVTQVREVADLSFVTRAVPGRIQKNMELGEHLHITGAALKKWILAQFQDSLAVGVLWL